MSAAQQGPTTRLSPSLTRRTAITGALGATALLAATRTAAAQEATPAPDDVSYLFLQVCEGGSATVVDEAERVYDLTLAHDSGQTLYFSDRPDRIAGIIPTDVFLDEVAAFADDPPNAALAFSPEGASDEVAVAVVELTSPSADPEASTITWQGRLIDAGQDQSGASAGEMVTPVTALPASFGQATLFFDDIPPITPIIVPAGTSTHFPVSPDN